jgi:prevent-host-death family protein
MKMNMRDAKAQLSRLVDAAMLGEDVIIAKAGKPCVRLVPLDQPPRQPGAAKGKTALTPAFFDPRPDNERGARDGD